MGDSFPLFNDCDPAVLSTLKQYLSQPNNNDEDNGDGYATFCFHYKGAILRSIEQRTGNSTVPDAVLDSLILIENLDRRRGFLPSESMKAAFCAVAVHCTVSCLPVSWDNYFDAFQRIWGLRIKSLEESDNVVSASAQVPSSPHPCIDERNMDNVVYSSAQVPSSPHPSSDEGNSMLLFSSFILFNLNFAFKRLCHVTTALLAGSTNSISEALEVGERVSSRIAVKLVEYSNKDKDNPTTKIRRASFQARHKPRPRCKQRRGVVITDMEEDQPLCIKNGTPSSFEVNGRLQVSSKTRSAALLDGVTDSPFEALEVVETVASVMAGKNFCPKGSMEDSNKDKGDPTASFYPTTHHCTDKGKQIQMVNSQTSGNPNSSHRHCEEPAAIADTEEDRVLSTPNIDKLRDALTSSVADLTASVTDPLPKALEVAERLVSFMEAAKSLSAEEIRRASFQARHKPRPRCKQPRGVVITDMEEDQPLCTKNGTPSSFEVNGCLQVASKTRSAALLDGVTDSPSEALEVLETVALVMAGKNFHPKGSVEDSNKDKEILMVNSQTSGNPNSSHSHCEGPAATADIEEDRALSTPDIDKLRDALTSSIADLTATVADPLPKALEVAERLVSFMAAAKSLSTEGAEGDVRKEKGVPAAPMNCNFEQAQAERRAPDKAIREDQDKMGRSVPASSVGHSVQPSQATEGNETFIRPKKVPKRNLMKRNDAAHTHELNSYLFVHSYFAKRRAPYEGIREDYNKVDGSVPAPSVNHIAEPSHAKEGNEAVIRPKKVRKRSIMERNDTAHTSEWEDSIDGSDGGTSGCSNRCTLPSPKTNHVSPLKESEPQKQKNRRKTNWWTLEEEQALIKGYRVYGPQWKLIRESYWDILKKRTQCTCLPLALDLAKLVKWPYFVK
ncbi:hypothetical protein GOBAR_AA11147 [Gossypium barbadense]|uniref:Myb-like domain-containing protein n=1 Tax=Gossypium barbadense TaxID=3634 RepID=A0A2P5Y1M9_GOSBA|nr:hypothetical protein GOBAR_AA11147 [Gossypium barbadense]